MVSIATLLEFIQENLCLGALNAPSKSIKIKIMLSFWLIFHSSNQFYVRSLLILITVTFIINNI